MTAFDFDQPGLPPWLMPHWHRLWESRRGDRLGHALLLSGPAGIGKRLFADRFAAALLCRSPAPDGTPCGACADCTLLRAGNHPDSVHVTPEPDAKSPEIKAEAIRTLCAQQALTPSRGVRKVLQIVPAEAMNAFAANSLLKTLEEPVASSLLILIGEAPERLPATVTSRCQRIGMLPPDAETGAAWLSARVDAKRFDLALLLRLAHDAPLRALTLADAEGLAGRERAFEQLAAVARGEQDPIAGAAAWQPLDPRLVLEWLSAWVSDLVRLAQTPGAAYLSSPDKHAQLMALAPGLDCAQAHRYLRRVLDYRALIDAPLNKGLLFEALLVDWAKLVRGTE